MMCFAVFKDVDGATQIVFDHLPATALAVHTSENTGIRRCINHPVRIWERLHVAGYPEITVPHSDAQFLQSESVQFASRADKVVKTKNLHASKFSRSPMASAFPTNPQMPVIKMRMMK